MRLNETIEKFPIKIIVKFYYNQIYEKLLREKFSNQLGFRVSTTKRLCFIQLRSYLKMIGTQVAFEQKQIKGR